MTVGNASTRHTHLLVHCKHKQNSTSAQQVQSQRGDNWSKKSETTMVSAREGFL